MVHEAQLANIVDLWGKPNVSLPVEAIVEALERDLGYQHETALRMLRDAIAEGVLYVDAFEGKSGETTRLALDERGEEIWYELNP